MTDLSNKRPIGVYDSGVGGLTVLKELERLMPNETFVYFADTANLPYGNKTKEQIIDFSQKIISWFQDEIDAKMVIAACHTSSALAIDSISYDFQIPIIGTIYPLLNCILNNDAHKKIGIIATEASAASRMHEKIFRQNGYTGEIHSIGCPSFVPLIESNHVDNEALKKAAEGYLKIFDTHKLDTLIYGCTHYPLLKSVIEEILPKHINYIDPAEHIAKEALALLTESNQLNPTKSTPNHFFCSHDAKMFSIKLEQLLGSQNAGASTQLRALG